MYEEEEQSPPILISGNPRSGTTWMQWFLSQHPRIHIHGQEPNLSWSEMWRWYERMVEQGQWATKSQRYDIAHYAGSDRQRCRAIFRRMYRDYMTGYGPQKPRWGLKSLWTCATPETVSQFESLWPDTRWVICIRHPFTSFNSQKNTFVPKMDVEVWCRRWLATAQFVETHAQDRVVLFQIDHLHDASTAERRNVIERVLQCVGETATAETEQFIEEWPRVHEVRSREKRTFAIAERRKRWVLDQLPELAAYAAQLGYDVP